MGAAGFRLWLARVINTVDGPKEELVQIGEIYPDWPSVSQALQEYYAAHGGADVARREFKGGIRVEWIRGDEARPSQEAL